MVKKKETVKDEIIRMTNIAKKERKLMQQMEKEKILELLGRGKLTNMYFTYKQLIFLITSLGSVLNMKTVRERWDKKTLEEMDNLRDRLQGYMLIMQELIRRDKERGGK